MKFLGLLITLVWASFFNGYLKENTKHRDCQRTIALKDSIIGLQQDTIELLQNKLETYKACCFNRTQPKK